MGRKNPVAGIYCIRNIVDNKIYFGESSNLADRLSHYRTVGRYREIGKYPTNIEMAIQIEGIENFCFSIVASSHENEKLFDDIYRRKLETAYIRRYNTTDPRIGYNSKEENFYRNCGKKQGTPTATSTKILKSKPVIGYNFARPEVFIYTGAASAADDLGIDKAIVARCCKNGKSTHDHQFFYLDYDKRLKYATEILTKKFESSNTHPGNGLASKSIDRYLEALKAANELCVEFGFKPIDIDKLLNNIDSTIK